MFEEISNQVLAILSITVGGVSVGGIVGMAIYVIKQIRANRKQITVTKESIEKAFQDAVLPKSIKLDVSNKIEKPIKEGLAQIELAMKEKIEHLEQGEQLILSILQMFSHVQKLPEEVQKAIADYTEGENSKDVTL